MKTYFTIQYHRLLRGMKVAGVQPYAGIPAIALAFPLLSVLLFKRTVYAPWLYAAIPLLLVYPLGNTERNNFLQMLFPVTKYRQLRLIENILVTIPFGIILALYQQYLLTLTILLCSAALSRFNKVNRAVWVVPSPFSRHPFEFTTGFRKQYWMVLLLYVLMGIALTVGNFNLGLFALAGMLLVCFGFYTAPEPEFYVWIYHLSPYDFLLYKIKTALRYSLLLCLPAALVLSGFCPNKAYIVGLLLLAGALNITMSAAAKYTNYPQQPGLPQLICMAMGLLFPPALLILIPYFFKRSQQQLNPYLS